MRAEHFEVLVEEPSMEAFLIDILPRILGDRSTFSIYVHQGKTDLLGKLRYRLRGYSKWLPANWRIVVLVDRDDDDCVALKQRLEEAAADAHLATPSAGTEPVWRVVNRIAVEELEAWFFGDWAAVRRAYPKTPKGIVKKAAYRDCDLVAGGTWESLERILKSAGYFPGGLRKVEAAREIAKYFDHQTCTSPSFIALRASLLDAST